MKKLYATSIIVLSFHIAFAQGFSMGDLVNLTSATTSQFDNYVSKKGYRSAGLHAESNSRAYTYFDKKAKEIQPDKQIYKHDKDDKAVVAYQTTVQAEFDRLCQQLQQEGYSFSRRNGEPFYQKGNITITASTRLQEEKPVYSFTVEKKSLPTAREVMFAEDLLQLTSHEYLVAVFGRNSVRKDAFYFSEDEVNSCSVLFPNTGNQVIFIWKDEAGKRELDFLLIGGHLRTAATAGYNQQVELSNWQSKQGLRTGMTLQELQDLNGGPFSIHGWNSDRPGVVAENNKGKIDFKKVGVVLNCLNCIADGDNSSTLNSANLLNKGRRVYVSTLVVLPTR